MIIGVPKEVKEGEYRIAMTPDGVKALTGAGHTVRVQRGAGQLAGFPDAEYRRAGAVLERGASRVWASDMVVKVKEPLPSEFHFFRPDLVLFAFLHLAPNRPLTLALLKKKVIAIGYETVEEKNGHLPILRAMSEIAGRIAVIMGNYFQANPQGGRGVLFGGVSGVAPAHVVILGGGTVGENAARVATRMGSRVTILESRKNRIAYLKRMLHPYVTALHATPATVQRTVREADILVGALHIPGARTPRLVNRTLVRRMKPRSVIVDVAIDQGGSCDTSRPTSHLHPTYVAEGVLHYCVPNMPGAYARTSTQALSHVTLPYILALARMEIPQSLNTMSSLAKGVQCYKGNLVCAPVAQAHHFHYEPCELFY